MNVHPDSTVIKILLELACRAPSVHNSQPWRWTYGSDRLDLYADRRRTLGAIDPVGRQLIISCGAALDHLRTAAVAFKWDPRVDEFPLPGAPQHLARVRFVYGARPRSHEFDLLTAMHHRRSDRRPFGRLPADRTVTDRMRAAAELHRTGLTVLSEDARLTLAKASRSSAEVRRYDSTYQAELRWWAGHSFATVGIPPESRTDTAESSRVALARSFPTPREGERGVPASGSTTLKPPDSVDESTVLLLSTGSDSRMDWLRCGETLSAVLLEATAAGYASCALTHLTEQTASRALIESLVPNGGVPQVLVRIGMPAEGPPPRPTPRQNVSSVLTVC